MRLMRDVLNVVRAMPAASVQAVVTSPPFWGQRVYADEKAVLWRDGTTVAFGREGTPEAYVAHTLEILGELARVLKPTGSIWWNIGDSYMTRTILKARACMQRRLLEPEDSADNDPEGAVAVGQLLVAGGQAAILFAAGDQPLNDIPLSVGRPVEGASAVLVGLVGDGVADTAAAAGLPDLPAAVALVADDALWTAAGPAASRSLDRHPVQQLVEHRRLVRLARRERHRQRLARALRAQVNLGTAAAPAAAERLLFGPPFPLAACWCARIVLPSTNCTSQSSRPSASACCWTAANSRSQTPARRQRRSRLASVGQGPYRSGVSRQGAPVRTFHKMPSMIRRWSSAGRPTRGFWGGSNGANRSHWSFVKSPRFVIHNSTDPDACLHTRPSLPVVNPSTLELRSIPGEDSPTGDAESSWFDLAVVC